MIHRANFTRRRRIKHEDVPITIRENKDDPSLFDIDLRLERYKLPVGSSVFVEAYRQTSWMRFEFGTVEHIVSPKDRRLTEFDNVEGILFRVKVTSTEGPHGLLLAEADKILFHRAEEKEDKRTPLLAVKPEDIGDEVFRLNFTDEPILLINSSISDWRSLSLSPAFISLAYPIAFREILTQILRIERHSDTEDESDWRSRWLRFATFLPGVSQPPGDDEDDQLRCDWIEEAVSSFCRRHRMMDRFGSYWTEEVSK